MLGSLLQLLETFELILAMLEELVYLTQGLIVIVFFTMLINIAIAKNTQPSKELKALRAKGVSKRRRLWKFIKRDKGPQLPTGEPKELAEK